LAETSKTAESIGAESSCKNPGISAFQNLDIFAAAGARAAFVRTLSDGTKRFFRIEFDNVVQMAKIDAIEILPVAGASSQLAIYFFYPDAHPCGNADLLGYFFTAVVSRKQPLTNGSAVRLFASPNTMGINAQFQST